MTPERRIITEHWIASFERAARDQEDYMRDHPEEMKDRSTRLLQQAHLDCVLFMAETLRGQLAEYDILEKNTEGGVRSNPWQRHAPTKYWNK